MEDGEFTIVLGVVDDFFLFLQIIRMDRLIQGGRMYNLDILNIRENRCHLLCVNWDLIGQFS